MAIAKTSIGITDVNKGLQQKASTLKPPKSFGAYFQRSGHSTTIRAKNPLSGYYGRGRPYEKERFCYVDMLYRAMDKQWFDAWISYYRFRRDSKYPMIFPTTERECKHPLVPDKEMGVYSYFMSTWIKNNVAAFNEEKIKSAWIIQDLNIEDGQLEITFMFTNRIADQTVPISFFDPNLIRFGGRI